MSDTSANNKRIAKNTLMLYVRMLCTMVVSLYTSRVILQTLGVEDYGIYNVVGGIAALFSFITASMSQAIQRFITFELGKQLDRDVSKVFSVGIELQLCISIVIMILVEIVGIWMINNKLQIPSGRINAAFWVLQFTILTIPITLLNSPYNALIIAHEKMQAFAYISILEVLAKLAIAFALIYTTHDKLIVYGMLYMLVMLLIRFGYILYCKRFIPDVKFVYTKDFSMIRGILSFAGWNMYGALAYVGFTQGLNILLNMFFCPIVNAARGIAVQIQSTIYSFIINFQTAINPQITKTYASNDIVNMHILIFRSAKFSFILIALISIPILYETSFILNLWLKDVPDYTKTFVRIIIITSWISAIENPISYAVQASGQIKRYQIVVSTIRLMILPISYFFLTLGSPAYIVFVVHFCVDFLVIAVRLILLQPIINFPIWKFVREVIAKDVFIIALCNLFLLPVYLFMSEGVIKLVIISAVELLLLCLLFYIVALNQIERMFIIEIIKKIIHKS